MDNLLDRSDLVRHSEQHLDALQRHWLQPLNGPQATVHRFAFHVNRGAMRALFGLRAEGVEHLRISAPFVLTPNHSSSLDPFALAASLPYEIVRHTRWAGRKGAVLRNPLRRFANRIALTIPIDRDRTALAAAAAVLERGENLVWFPEGTRSRDGELQPFRPGIGTLLRHFDMPAIPVFIAGAYAAMPPDRRWPRRRPIRVVFGPPLRFRDFGGVHDGDELEGIRQFVTELRARVQQLARQ